MIITKGLVKKRAKGDCPQLYDPNCTFCTFIQETALLASRAVSF